MFAIHCIKYFLQMSDIRITNGKSGGQAGAHFLIVPNLDNVMTNLVGSDRKNYDNNTIT